MNSSTKSFYNEGTQLELPIFVPTSIPIIYDPAWDKLSAPEQNILVLEQVVCDTSTPLEQRNDVLEQVQNDTVELAPEQLAPEQQTIHWVEEYSPSNRKKYKYYRYCYMQGRKIKHVHLPGGSVDKPGAIAKYHIVVLAIAQGKLPHEIILQLSNNDGAKQT